MRETIMRLTSLRPDQIDLKDFGGLLVKLDEAIRSQYKHEHTEAQLQELQQGDKPLISILRIEANCTSAVLNISEEVFGSYITIPKAIKNPPLYGGSLCQAARKFIEYGSKFAKLRDTDIEFEDAEPVNCATLERDKAIEMPEQGPNPCWQGGISLFGEITNIGGILKPHFVLHMPNSQQIPLEVESKEKAQELSKFLYCQVKISGEATFELVSQTETKIKSVVLKHMDLVKRTNLKAALKAISPFLEDRIAGSKNPTYALRD